MATKIVVVGAGVSGLTCALLLAKHRDNHVTVVARHMPGDYDINFTSPWAGANVLPMAPGTDAQWERRTWPELKRLTEEVPEAGIHFQKAKLFRRNQDAQGGIFPESLFELEPWYHELFPNFRELDPAKELPPGYDSGCEFTTVCINTQVYLPWLQGQCIAHGVSFKRASVTSLGDARFMHLEDEVEESAAAREAADDVVVVNAAGLEGGKLSATAVGNDGEDRNKANDVIPVRGQTVLVRNKAPYMATTSGTDDGDSADVCYVMTRAAGGGTILGGTYDKGNTDPVPDPAIAERIMRRAIAAVPELVKPGEGIEGLHVVRHGVGLRPLRTAGVRLEKEYVRTGDGGGTFLVVHDYGHAGWGYQGSYGCAERVVELIEEAKSLAKAMKELGEERAYVERRNEEMLGE